MGIRAASIGVRTDIGVSVGTLHPFEVMAPTEPLHWYSKDTKNHHIPGIQGLGTLPAFCHGNSLPTGLAYSRISIKSLPVNKYGHYEY